MTRWVLRKVALLLLMSACAMAPTKVGRHDAQVPPPDPKVTAIQRAYRDVDAYLEPRMPYLDSERRTKLARTIVDESIEKQFDPLFILAVIEAESNYDHEAVSPTGAKGLMQVIPSTWNLVTERYGLGKLEKFNPVNSVRVGVSYLHLLATSFKRPETMLLAYNQGPGTASDILTSRAQPNEEAQAYGPKILSVYRRILKEHGVPVPKDLRKLYRNPFGSLVKGA